MPPILFHRNRTVRVDQSQIIENALSETYLTADKASGVSTLTVANIEKFAIGKYVWINPFAETSEIIAVHASTAPTGTTVTLATTTASAHYTGEKVYYIEFNQAEISNAATLTGSKSVLTTTALLAGGKELIYLDTANSSGYYFARFKDSIAGTFGSYSDGCLYGGFASGTIGYMIDRALRDLGLQLSELVSTQDCLQWVNDGLLEIKGKLKRWPEHYTYNSVIGQTSRGTNVITMPGADDTETFKSLLAIRVGNNKNLQLLDPVTFDAQMEGVQVTTTRSSTAAASTSLPLSNSYDFNDSGSVHVYISGTKYTITYTGVTRDTASGATAALTGVPASGTGSVTVTIPSGTYVWQNEEEGIPRFACVRNGAIEFWPLADSSNDNMNVYADYNATVTAVDSEGDSIDFNRYKMLQPYLTWRMKMKARNSGNLDLNDGWYAKYKELLNDAIRTLVSNNIFKVRPRINRMLRNRGFQTPDLQDLSTTDQ